MLDFFLFLNQIYLMVVDSFTVCVLFWQLILFQKMKYGIMFSCDLSNICIYIYMCVCVCVCVNYNMIIYFVFEYIISI